MNRAPMAAGRLRMRMARAGVTLIGLTLATFLLLRLLPGDPALVRLGDDAGRVSAGTYRQMLDRIGWDDPVPLQYARWLSGVLRGDLGTSVADGRPVATRIGERLPASLLLGGLSLTLVFLLAGPAGVLMARHPGRLLDRAAHAALLVLFALPSFWIASLLQDWLAVRHGLFPMQGITSLGMQDAGWTARVADRIRHLVLPTICLTYGQLAFLARFTRASVLETLGQDYVRTARSKGLAEAAVLRRHAVRGALLPLLTLLGLALPSLVGGSVLIETIFSWPGLGSLFFESISRRDYPLVMGLVLLSAVVTLLGNLLADCLYGVADRRAAADRA